MVQPIIGGGGVQVPLDPYLPLRALSNYAGLSVRKLRQYLTELDHPLPHYRVGGKILVRRSEFDKWMCHFKREGRPDLDRIVEEVTQGL